MSEVLLIKKVRGSRNRWTWTTRDVFGELSAPEGDLELQMGTVYDQLLVSGAIQSGMSVMSPQLGHKHLNDFMTELFPTDYFYPLNEHALVTFFERAFALAEKTNGLRKTSKKSTLYISSDASSDSIGQHSHSTWAWASENNENGFNFGYSGTQDINTTELEGILNAIVDNKDTRHDRIHVYSDSSNSVEAVNMDLSAGIIPREARKFGFQKLAREAYEVMNEREVVVQWVRGHKGHRLNNAADVISRTVRKRYTSGYSRTEFEREIKAIHQIFVTN